MKQPDDAYVKVLGEHSGLSLPAEYLARAAATHARLRPALRALREAPLPYLEAVDVLQVHRWIERGGRTLPATARAGSALPE